jgi:hypothetical protein
VIPILQHGMRASKGRPGPWFLGECFPSQALPIASRRTASLGNPAPGDIPRSWIPRSDRVRISKIYDAAPGPPRRNSTTYCQNVTAQTTTGVMFFGWPAARGTGRIRLPGDAVASEDMLGQSPTTSLDVMLTVACSLDRHQFVFRHPAVAGIPEPHMF